MFFNQIFMRLKIIYKIRKIKSSFSVILFKWFIIITFRISRLIMIKNFFENEYLYFFMLFKLACRVCEKKLFLNNVYFSTISIIILFNLSNSKVNNNDLIYLFLIYLFKFQSF